MSESRSHGWRSQHSTFRIAAIEVTVHRRFSFHGGMVQERHQAGADCADSYRPRRRSVDVNRRDKRPTVAVRPIDLDDVSTSIGNHISNQQPAVPLYDRLAREAKVSILFHDLRDNLQTAIAHWNDFLSPRQPNAVAPTPPPRGSGVETAGIRPRPVMRISTHSHTIPTPLVPTAEPQTSA